MDVRARSVRPGGLWDYRCSEWLRETTIVPWKEAQAKGVGVMVGVGVIVGVEIKVGTGPGIGVGPFVGTIIGAGIDEDITVVLRIHPPGGTHLTVIVQTLEGQALGARAGQGGSHNTGEASNDGNDGNQFGERKSSLSTMCGSFGHSPEAEFRRQKESVQERSYSDGA